MMFFFKRKKIVVDAFVSRPAIFEYAKIQETNKFLPEWWKKLPTKVTSVLSNSIELKYSTMKRCDGFLDLYRHGIIMPLWCDLTIKTTPDNYSWNYSGSGLSPLESHPNWEYGPEFDNYIHLKIASPWIFSENTGVKFHFAPASWSQIDYWKTMVIVPGVIEYKNQCTTNINMFVPKINNQIQLEHGQPMVHIIPLSENNVEVRNHLLSDEEWRVKHERISWKNTFNGRLKFIKKIEKQSKCPFGFGK